MNDQNPALRDTLPGSPYTPAGMRVNDRGSPLVSTHDVMLVQEAMQAASLYRGPIDGIPGSKTLNAIRAYRKRHAMPIGTLLDEDFIAHVRYQT